MSAHDDNSTPSPKRQRVSKPSVASHPAKPAGLKALQQAYPLPDASQFTVEVDPKTGATSFVKDGKESSWLVLPVVMGLKRAPEGHYRYKKGEQMSSVLYFPTHFQGDTSKPPKGRLVIFPSDECKDFLLAMRKKLIEAFVDQGIHQNALPGPWKSKHNKEFEKCKDRAAKIEMLTKLADMDEAPVINFPLRKSEKESTPSEEVWTLSANFNVIRPNKSSEPSPSCPEFGPDVNNWLELHPGDMVGVAEPCDLHGNAISWKTLRENKPDNIPLNFTGMIREFGISPQAVNKDAGGKVFCNTFFDKTIQIASYEKGERASDDSHDVSRFFEDVKNEA